LGAGRGCILLGGQLGDDSASNRILDDPLGQPSDDASDNGKRKQTAPSG
jgi:hypothetical protein